MDTNELNGMSPEKSLRIISEMIEKSRKDFEKDSGTPMILWGAIVALVSAAIWYILENGGNGYWNFLWFAIPVIGYPAGHFLYGKNAEKRARSFLNDAIGYVWAAFGTISMLLAIISCFFFNAALGHISTLIILLLGFSSLLTGMLIRNRAIAAGGAVTAVAGSLLSVTLAPACLPLLMAGSSIVSLLIPGLIINLKRK